MLEPLTLKRAPSEEDQRDISTFTTMFSNISLDNEDIDNRHVMHGTALLIQNGR